ncbi:MAG: hypothetical protein ABEH65_08435 [Halobacteriales archaeon]
MVSAGARRTVDTGTRFFRDVRAQSGTIGVVLLLAITVISTGAIVTFGSDALIDTRQASQLQRTEHAMTLFDSRAAMVALGDSDAQTVSLGQESGGAYHVREGTGWIRVEHLNYTASASDPKNETIYNRSLGSIEYVNEETTIAYQGGGVWRKTGNNSRMVSVPEFHYRAATLTLPVIRINGSGSTAGRTWAVVSSQRQAHHVFPNRTDVTADGVGAPYDNDDEAYHNPVTNGTLRVTVRSDYYQGWAEFFRTRTDGNVTVHHNNDTVWVDLEATRTLGRFEMPSEGDSINVRGMADGHPIDTFTIELSPESQGNNHFTFWADQGTKQFEIHFEFANNPCTDRTVDYSVYYYNGSGDTYQGWENESLDTTAVSGWSFSCSGGDVDTFEADLTSSVAMEYDDLDMSGEKNQWHFGDDIKNNDLRDPTTWDQHGDSISWEDGTGKDYSETDTETADNVTNHYFSLMGPDVDLTVMEGPGDSDKIDESASSGNLDYDTDTSRFLNFLHVTDNEIKVELK